MRVSLDLVRMAPRMRPRRRLLEPVVAASTLDDETAQVLKGPTPKVELLRFTALDHLHKALAPELPGGPDPIPTALVEFKDTAVD